MEEWQPPVISGFLFFCASMAAKYGDSASGPLEKGAYYAISAALYIGTFYALSKGWILAMKKFSGRKIV